MKFNGAKIIVEALLAEGVDTLFCYPGGAVINLFDEFYNYQDRLHCVTTCHEQGAVHAAEGFARATGKTGVVVATSGPGATNLVTGLANAYLDSSPLVAITGNVACAFIGRDSFQEVDITGITMPITKHNYIVKDVGRLAEIIHEAFAIARSGRPGPVLIDVPKDVQQALAEYQPDLPTPAAAPADFCPKNLQEAIALINASERPFIYVGGGVISSDACQVLLEFAECIDAPVGSSMMGLTALPHAHPRFLGMTGMHGKFAASRTMFESDLLIAVGTRFSDRATGNKLEFIKGKKLLHIDIDSAEISKNIPATVSLIGSVKQVLDALLSQLKPANRRQWHQIVEDIRNSPDSHLEMPADELNPETTIKAVRQFTGDDTVICTDVGQHQMWTAQYYPFARPRTFLTSGGLGTMGFGMGAAIGACLGKNRQKTVLFTSDGSFHMNLNEMATAVTLQLPLVVVLLNNQVLGMVRQWQAMFFGQRYANTTLNRRTDYVKLAEAFGAEGYRVTRLAELDAALSRAFAASGPALVEVQISPDDKVLPMIPPNGSMRDIILKA